MVKPREYYSIVRQGDFNLDMSIVDSIKAKDSVEQALPVVYWPTPVKLIIGGETPTDILQVRDEDMDLLLNRMGMKIVDGRKPAPGSHEILMNKFVASNKHLKVGDAFGSLINREDALYGSYTIVGLVEGGPTVSFVPLDTVVKDFNMKYEYMYGVLILPKAGQMEALNTYLDRLSSAYNIITYGPLREKADIYLGNIILAVDAFSIIVMIIVSICTGFLFYIYFFQRRNEFGLLNALGYSRQKMMNQAFLEIGIVNVSGLILGVLLSMLTGNLLNESFYMPMGQYLDLLDLNSAAGALCVPILSMVSSILPVWRMLRKIDPIGIIEGAV